MPSCKHQFREINEIIKCSSSTKLQSIFLALRIKVGLRELSLNDIATCECADVLPYTMDKTFLVTPIKPLLQGIR